MRRLLAVWLAAVIATACGADEVRPPDAFRPDWDGPAPIADAACGAVDAETSAQARVQLSMLGCGCCGEGTQACVTVTVSAAGLVSEINPGETASISDPALDCVRADLVGQCLSDFAGQTSEVCTFGI